MELPSPVASLIPSLVLKAVVTFGSLLFWLAAIPIRRVPVFARLGPPTARQKGSHGEEAQAKRQDE
jgi:hypothetical protein